MACSWPRGRLRRGNLFRSRTERLTFLMTIDPTQADTLRVGVVQNFDGVAVKNSDNGTGGAGSSTRGERKPYEDKHS